MASSVIYEEKWYKKAWRPALAFVYAGIVIFDFIIMPTIIELTNKTITNEQAVVLALKFTDPIIQVQSLQSFTAKRTWNPLTLLGGGMFHLSFGVLLTGAAITRGLEKKQHAINGIIIN